MTFESGFFLILLGVAALIVLFIVPKTINWLVGRTVIPMWLALILIPGGLIAGSLFLDSAGTRTPVQVVGKREGINNGKYGSWSRTLSVQINYQSPRERIPAQMSVGCDAETFDSLQIGQTVEARILDFGEIFKFARLSNQSTISALNRWLAGLFPPKPAGPWRQTNATVSHVKEVTEYVDRSGRTVLPWPYYVVELTFVPEGKRDSVIAVDVVDAASVPGLKKGDAKPVLYAADIPRSAHLVGAQPAKTGSNRLYSIGLILAFAVGSILIIIAFSLLFQRMKRR